MEEDDMVIRGGSSLGGKRRINEGGRGVRAKIPLILPPPSLGLAPSPYPK
jgi:hypothetical protein